MKNVKIARNLAVLTLLFLAALSIQGKPATMFDCASDCQDQNSGCDAGVDGYAYGCQLSAQTAYDGCIVAVETITPNVKTGVYISRAGVL
jgi:hypothetical protein